LSGNETDARKGAASVTLLGGVLAAQKQTGSALADGRTVVLGSVARVCTLIGKSDCQNQRNSLYHRESREGNCAYGSVGATVRPVGEEALAFVACHASSAFVGSHGHAEPENEVDEIHLDGEAVVCCGGRLCMIDCIRKTAI
jgi:hypothetical protein